MNDKFEGDDENPEEVLNTSDGDRQITTSEEGQGKRQDERRGAIRKSSIGNPHPRGAINEVTAFISQEKLIELAKQYQDTEDVRGEVKKIVEAYLTVLTGKPENAGENIAKAIPLGVNFASTDVYPLSAANVAIYENERELLHFTGPYATDLIVEKVASIQERLSQDSEDATKLVRDLSLIAQARIGGARPDEILTLEKLRTLLATELAGREVFRQLSQARVDIRTAIEAFAASSNGSPKIKGAPLMEGQQRISRLCQALAKSLYEVDIMASVVTSGNCEPIEPEGQYSEQTMIVLQKAKSAIEPFINGSYMVTIEQLRNLESCLIETGEVSEGVANMLKDAISRIKLQMEAGNNDKADEIEAQIGIQDKVPAFENMVKTLDADLSDRGMVLLYARVQNRIVLRSVPASMLREAERTSGLPDGYTEESLKTDVVNELIVPSSTPPPRLKD